MMAGFGAMKGHEVSEIPLEALEDNAPPPKEQVGPAPVIALAPPPTMVASAFPNLEAEFMSQTNPNRVRPSKVFCGLVGHEGTGKSGIAIDGHMHRYPQGMVWALDFDNGAMACKEAHYPGNDEQIRTWSPWVMQTGDRTAYDYPATHNRVMSVLRYAIEHAQKQTDAGFTGMKLNTFLVTGVDQFDQVCMNNMKIYDLEDPNVKDAIGAAKVEVNQGIGWNWNIRSTRFKQLTALCQRLNSLGVDVYWETHLKEDKDGKIGFDGWKFAWEKSANNDLFQIIWCHARKVRNEDGKETGETRHIAEFFKEKTNSDLKSQERLYFTTKKGEPANWLGLSELREGVL
jgi:hypothetical protein